MRLCGEVMQDMSLSRGKTRKEGSNVILSQTCDRYIAICDINGR